MSTETIERQAYIVGGGIAGLATAVYLVRDGQIKGENVHILEETPLLGGSLDSTGNSETGYSMRGGRMFEGHFGCTFDLLQSIPSVDDPARSVKDEIFDFYKQASWNSKSRLIDRHGQILNAAAMGFNAQDRRELIGLTLSSEKKLGTKTIQDVFNPHFFTTNYWFMWCTIFAFEPWHSAVEMKRYLERFVHLFPMMNTMTGIVLTRYNQNDSMVKPIVKWLEARKVGFETGTRVTDLDLSPGGRDFAVTGIKYERQGRAGNYAIQPTDLVVVTNGSMTAASSLGSMTSAPVPKSGKLGGSWELWQTLAAKRPGLGNPDVFTKNPNQSKWSSFTVTTRNPRLKELITAYTANPLGRAGLLTFKDSNWLMTINFYHNPRSVGQTDDCYVWWGYGLNPDAKGNYVAKKMCECSGEELLTEVFGHLHFEADALALIKSSIAIPCYMPYITSQFMPRAIGDRPEVIPAGSRNLAFVGQYAEVPHDCVFTVEYSVRTAAAAAYGLLGMRRRPVPMYQGKYNPLVLFRAWKTMHQN